MGTNRNPVEFVCPEIWEIIFDKVQHCGVNDHCEQTIAINDLHNCSQVCVMFWNILYPTRTTWLFGEIFQFVIRYLDARSVLAYRATCISWKFAVDHFLENKHNHLNRHREKGYLSRVPFYVSPFEMDESDMLCQKRSTFFKSTIHLQSTISISNFLHDFASHTGCPFPGRTLTICNLDAESDEEHINLWKVDVIQLLSRFGDQIHNLHLLIGVVGSAHTSWIQIVFGCLSLTPNLRRLRIDGASSLLHGNEDESLLGGNATGVPALPYLNSLQFARHNDFVTGSYFTVLPFPFERKILAPYSRQLRRLQISMVDMPCKDFKESSLGIVMPNVLELTVRVKSPEQFEAIVYCVSSALRGVIIEIVNGRHKVGDYLEILQRFTKSLRVLAFIAFPQNHWQMARATKSDMKLLGTLTKLGYLQIEGFKLTNVEIVTSLPRKLKYLQLDYKHDFCHMFSVDSRESWSEHLGPGVSADLQDEHEIYSSEMWRLLPRLRWLSVAYSTNPVRNFVYRRENWERWLQGERKLQDGSVALRVFRVRNCMQNCARSCVRKIFRGCCYCICCMWGCIPDDEVQLSEVDE